MNDGVHARRLRQSRSWVFFWSISSEFEAFRGPEALSPREATDAPRRWRGGRDGSLARRRRDHKKFKFTNDAESAPSEIIEWFSAKSLSSNCFKYLSICDSDL